MQELAQDLYNMLMDYIAFNQKSGLILSKTTYTGFFRWHSRNHRIFDKLNCKIIKHFGNVYGVTINHEEPKMYQYTTPSNIIEHLTNWENIAHTMKEKTAEQYKKTIEVAKDFELAEICKDINKLLVNEMLFLKRVKVNMENGDNTNNNLTNKNIHDFFEANEKTKKIDISI